MLTQSYLDDAVALLKDLIATPRVSRQETAAADLMEQRMAEWGLNPQREGNNLWALPPAFDPAKPTLLLNAHIDTVKPVASWTRDPHRPVIEGDRLYGLGSNDCGGGLVTLLQLFRLGVRSAYNLVYLASSEEEVSGKDGFVRALPVVQSQLAELGGQIDVAIVGEPTGLQPAVAEKGLMVIDGYAHGVSGHAARNEGVNAIYEALDDLLWLRDYRFPKVSELLGPTKMSVTQVEAGTQHNVVPDLLHFVIDVRTNEHYGNEEVLTFLQSQMRHCDLKARSTRLHSSHIPLEHPLIRRCISLGLQPYGSPTLSDQALMPFPSLKLGPGESARSHSADEFICISELQRAIELYQSIITT